jgi:uncharacterized membrane protein
MLFFLERSDNLKNSRYVYCQICEKEKKITEVVDISEVRKSTTNNIKKQYPKLNSSGYICTSCLNSYRKDHILNSLQSEKDVLTDLDQQVINKSKDEKMLVTEIYKKIDEKSTMGDKLADKAAEFGGSWRFILIFSALLIGWIIVNLVPVINGPYEPYPFAILNLVLSCLAAFQAPIIMMSQNRQEAKDRKRGEHDYQINSKAELEIQNINEKLNYLSDRLADLMEAQQIQTEMIQEFVEKHNDGIKDLESSQGKSTEDIINNQEKLLKKD